MRKLSAVAVLCAGLTAPVMAKSVPAVPLPAAIYTVSGAITVKSAASATPAITISNADGCAVSSNTANGTLFVSLGSSGTAQCAGSVTVEAPANTPVRAKSETGAISFSGMSGDLRAYTQGPVTLDHITGGLIVDGGSGDVTGTASSPKITVKTKTGNISIAGLKGSGSLITSGDITAQWDSVPASGEMLIQSPGTISASMPKKAPVKTSITTNGRVDNAFAESKGKFSLVLQTGKQITVTAN